MQFPIALSFPARPAALVEVDAVDASGVERRGAFLAVKMECGDVALFSVGDALEECWWWPPRFCATLRPTDWSEVPRATLSFAARSVAVAQRFALLRTAVRKNAQSTRRTTFDVRGFLMLDDGRFTPFGVDSFAMLDAPAGFAWCHEERRGFIGEGVVGVWRTSFADDDATFYPTRARAMLLTHCDVAPFTKQRGRRRKDAATIVPPTLEDVERLPRLAVERRTRRVAAEVVFAAADAVASAARKDQRLVLTEEDVLDLVRHKDALEEATSAAAAELDAHTAKVAADTALRLRRWGF